MKFVSYLRFAGNCREAFEFCGRVFGGEIVAMITHGERPAGEHVSKDWQDKIINAHLIVGDQELMGADSPPSTGGAVKAGFGISIQLDDEATPSAISTPLQKAAPSTCHLNRPSGLRDSA